MVSFYRACVGASAEVQTESRQFAEWLRKKNVKVRLVKEPLALHVKGYSSLVEGIAVRLGEIQQVALFLRPL
jgi:hypothetical protein